MNPSAQADSDRHQAASGPDSSVEVNHPEPELTTLEPRDGVPEVIDTPRGITRVVDALARGTGPVGVDAERASGFRYGQRAYLVQVYRTGGGTWLIDPIALPDLSRLAEVLAPLEWIIHAASQDLPCLAEIGLRPQYLFDTELAGRLLGRERVGLGPLVAAELGWHLEKGHGAADWSTRPLPIAWRRYAALDVEVLPALRDVLAADLETEGKLSWAREEFDALIAAPPAPERVDPWRRTSRIHEIRSRRGLAIVRSLWTTRDAVARERDIAPGRLLGDAAIVAAAATPPKSIEELSRLPGFSRGRAAGLKRIWWDALCAALAEPDESLPDLALRGTGPPPPRQWASRDQQAAQRLIAAKSALSSLSEQVNVPVENLGTPDAIRRVLWSPPVPTTHDSIEARLRESGLRPWQLNLVTAILVEACATDDEHRTSEPIDPESAD